MRWHAAQARSDEQSSERAFQMYELYPLEEDAELTMDQDSQSYTEDILGTLKLFIHCT